MGREKWIFDRRRRRPPPATASFFLGQADEFPERLRIFPLLVVLAFAPLVVLVYWLWRVRLRRSFRGIGSVGAHEST